MIDKNVQEWIKKADEDLDAAKYLLKAEDFLSTIIGFHCQQAVEKYLKAYIASKKTKIPGKHDLDVLFQLCAEFDPEFLRLDRERISALTSFAVEFRYPIFDLSVTKEEIEDYFKLAESAKSFINKKLNPPETNEDN